jgi:hypothetical protein
MKIKRTGRTAEQLHSDWYQRFVQTVENSPRIKDPAYIAWLAMLSFTVMEKGMKAIDVAAELELSRPYVYQLFNGEYTARQNVMERAALKIGKSSIAEFQQRGFELLGGVAAVENMMKDVYIKKVVTGVNSVKEVVTETSKTQALRLLRTQYQSSWGLMARLALVINEWGVYLVNLETTPSTIAEAQHLLVVSPDGTLTRTKNRPGIDRDAVRGVFIDPPANGWHMTGAMPNPKA